jgi:hypothetical protein
MFMRYLSGGIGHMAILAPPAEENAAMNTDEDANITVDDEEAAKVQGSAPTGQSVVDKLWQAACTMAGEGASDGWEDAEQTSGSDSDRDSGDESEDTGDEISLDGGSDQGNHGFGPEDGEDENYLDTGYDML